MRRTDYIDDAETGGITVLAAEPDLPATLGATLDKGVFLNAANARYPTVVLGATAAQRLGIDRTGVNVWLADRWFTVIGILDPVAARGEPRPRGHRRLPGRGGAARLRRPARRPSYVRADTDAVDDVRELLGASANPGEPGRGRREPPLGRARRACRGEGRVHRAVPRAGSGRAARRRRRHRERDGDRRPRKAIRDRSPASASAPPSATSRSSSSPSRCCSRRCGGAAGVALGAAVTGAYAASRDWSAVIPPLAAGGGIVAAIAIGAIAGLYPAVRAARLSPTEALRTV